MKYRLIVRASPSAEVKIQIAQKYSSRCGCGSSYHQASECPWGPEGWKDKYTQPAPVNHVQQFAVLTSAYNGGHVYTGVVNQQPVVRHPVQALGIQKKIQPQVFSGGGIICQPDGPIFVQMPQQLRIYCRARGCTSCTRPGQKHSCGKCGDANSDHRTQDCRVVVAHVSKSPIVIDGVLYWV